MKKRIAALIALLLAGLIILAGCGLGGNVTAAEDTIPAQKATAEPSGPIIEPQAIADYIFEHGGLPDNFITKKEAQALGWDSRADRYSGRKYVSDVAPGKSIGGDWFGNYENQLPKAKGRTFRECDCNYTVGNRGIERIVYSSDGHVWYTNDHYETFTELFPSNLSGNGAEEP